MRTGITFRQANQNDMAWFFEKTEYIPGPMFRGVVAIRSSDYELMGMVGCDGWTPRSCRMHWAIRYPRCIPALWNEVCEWLWGTGRSTIIGVTPSDNEASLKMVKRLGWREVHRLKDGWDDGVDLVMNQYDLESKNTQLRLVGASNE